MTTLIVTRGLPASGKTTFAKAWVATDVRHRARVERDALRAMMHDSIWKGHHTEDQITMVQYNMVYDLLKKGISVVVSDTNLDPTTFNKWREVAEKDLQHVTFEMEDFRHVPLETCMLRNTARSATVGVNGRVPDEAILNMYNRYIKEKA